MLGYHGEFEATLDAKNRFMIPMGIREQLKEGENKMVFVRGIEKCITMYGMEEWSEIVQKFKKLNPFDSEARLFSRLYLGGHTVIEFDSLGRVVMPATLKQHAGITKDIIITSMIDRFEIWDVEQYNNMLNSVTVEQLKALSDKVMKENGDKID